jgi:hypothetical protein
VHTRAEEKRWSVSKIQVDSIDIPVEKKSIQARRTTQACRVTTAFNTLERMEEDGI